MVRFGSRTGAAGVGPSACGFRVGAAGLGATVATLFAVGLLAYAIKWGMGLT